MKKSVMTKWVKALRSGKYEQGTGALCRDGKYCCLGVLCEVMGMPKGVAEDDGVLFYGLPESLSGSAAAEVGMKSSLGELNRFYKAKDGVGYDNLAELNDHGLSFKQIARIIEKNYKEL